MPTYEEQDQHHEEEIDHVEEDQHDYDDQQPKEEKKKSSVWVFVLLALAVVEAGVIGFLIYSNT